MKKVTISILLITILLLYTYRISEAKKKKEIVEGKFLVACVDTQQLFNNLPERAGIEDKLMDERKKLEKEIMEMEQKVIAQRKKLELKDEMISKTNVKDKIGLVKGPVLDRKFIEEDLRDLEAKYKILIRESNGKLSKKEDDLQKPLLDRISIAIQSVAERDGFSMVIDKGLYVMYFVKELDITKEVLREMKRMEKESMEGEGQ